MLSSKSSRFASASEVQIASSTLKSKVKNTDATTQNAINQFSAWCDEKKKDVDLSTISDSDWNQIIPQFIIEARKKNGEEYPANTLNTYLVGIQRYLHEVNPLFSGCDF